MKFLNLPSFPFHSSLRATRPSCAILAQFPAWYQASARFDPGDCSKAIDLFYSDYVKDHEGARYEYLASGVDPVHDIPTQRVPLRVSAGERQPPLRQAPPESRSLIKSWVYV